MHNKTTKDKRQRSRRWAELKPGLIRYMADEDISAKELARRIGVSYEAFHKYFAEVSHPSWDSMAKIEQFMSGQEPKQHP